jgi:hypothetical protein
MDDNNTSVTPQNGSNEHYVIDNLIRKAVRKSQQHQPSNSLGTLMSQPNICELINFIEDRINDAFIRPSQFFNELIAIEYHKKEFWTLNEATCLASGLDPFLFEHFQKDFPIKFHDRYTANFQYILLNMQPASVECMVPEEFCSWALEQNIVHENVIDFFQEIKHRYKVRPERISYVDTLRVSTSVSQQG